MHDSIADGATAHLCLYLREGEVHLDLESDAPTHSVEALAEHIAEATYELVLHFYKELQDANARQSSVQ